MPILSIMGWVTGCDNRSGIDSGAVSRASGFWTAKEEAAEESERTGNMGHSGWG